MKFQQQKPNDLSKSKSQVRRQKETEAGTDGLTACGAIKEVFTMRIIKRLLRTQQSATDILTNLGLISALLLTMVTINPDDLGSELNETLGAETVRSIHVCLAVGSFTFFAMCTNGCVIQLIFVSNFADDDNDDDLLKFFEESSMLMKGTLASFLIAAACFVGTVVLQFLTLLPFAPRMAVAVSYFLVLAVYVTSVFFAVRGYYRTLHDYRNNRTTREPSEDEYKALKALQLSITADEIRGCLNEFIEKIGRDHMRLDVFLRLLYSKYVKSRKDVSDVAGQRFSEATQRLAERIYESEMDKYVSDCLAKGGEERNQMDAGMRA